MLGVNSLSIQFGGAFLFDNVSFVVRERDRIGLIGRNGNGKSTLLKIIAAIQIPEQGNVSFPNGYRIGYLPQDLDTVSDKNVFDEASEALQDIKNLERRIDFLTNELNTRTDYESDEYSKIIEEMTEAHERFDLLGGGSADSIVEQILIGLGFIREEFDKLVQDFSGGWRMRIELAKILISKPNLILLDEPTNHLDIESVIWLESFLKDYDGALMIVSHDRRFLDMVTNRTIEIFRGKIYDYNLPYTKFIEQRSEQREIQIAAKKNQDKQIAQTERFIERFKAKATFASRAQSRVKMLDKMEKIEVEDEDTSAMQFRFPEPPRSGRLIWETKKLNKSYGPKHVLKNIEFGLERGERIAFVGKNGEGKSTLSKIIGGIESFEGDSESGHNVKLGYFSQHQASLLEGDYTVFEIIDNAAQGDMRTKVRSLLGAFLFSGDSVYKKVKVLSGGERARLALAKLLLEPINFLIMDEPTNHLDMVAKDVLKNALLEFTGAIIIVSHDREFLEGLTNKTVEFKGGGIKEYPGDLSEYLTIRQINNLDELEKNKAIKAEEKANPTPKNDAYKENKDSQKNNQKEISRLEKLIKEKELEVADMEIELGKLEKELAIPENFKDAAKSKTLNQNYQNQKQKLDRTMADWEKYQEDLDVLMIN
jgi:ATP-binding cassette subfamily F protein 3